jgi:hypothetical protein
MFERLLPDQIVDSIYDIDLHALKKRNIQGIITDLDNTLVSAKTALATPELTDWLDKVRHAGFRVVIVSNNNESRVSRFAEPLHIPFVHAARKPARKAFRNALLRLGLAPGQVVVVGDQLMTDILGGRRMGMHTILVSAVAPSEEGLPTRINRLIEKIVRARLRRTGRWPFDDQGRKAP